MKHYITFLALLATANEVGLRRMNWIAGFFVLGVIAWQGMKQLYSVERKENNEKLH